MTESKSIGAILVDEGRLSPEAAERIVQTQLTSNQLFGETGIRLGLLTADDLEFAIARQYDYSVILDHRDSHVSARLVAAHQPRSSQSEMLRSVRTQLLLRWLETPQACKSLAVVSPAEGEGRSFLAANLAVVFAQLGHNTLLVDADFRKPQQHENFGLSNRQGLSTLLQGRGDASVIHSVPELKNLSVLPCGPIPPNPQEQLSHLRFAKLLNGLAAQYDMVIVDTPAGQHSADATAVALRCGASLAVARKDHTNTTDLKILSTNLKRLGANLLGSVLLEF
ncbi:MAG TPA: chain length determinant protein tyrosine kinase EpsG [Limnobacter sp.]|uniref:chain length determinant protein tyrosine kinase EpsG n=1 Tax=Limnobacter sp. TaxID=2003368 RepID=UPI002EDBACAA